MQSCHETSPDLQDQGSSCDIKTNDHPLGLEIRGGAGEIEDLIQRECLKITAMLLQKNRAYGNSAFDPLRIFSKADPVEQINVRIDDKLSRIARGADDGEDTELDLIGYLVLKRVAKKLARAGAGETE